MSLVVFHYLQIILAPCPLFSLIYFAIFPLWILPLNLIVHHFVVVVVEKYFSSLTVASKLIRANKAIPNLALPINSFISQSF